MLAHVLPKHARWRRSRARRLTVWLSLVFVLFTFDTLGASSLLKIGVADNPPIVFKDQPGRAAGFAIDILEHVAHREQWRVEYVYAPWNELLDQLEARQLDLVVGIGSSDARQRRFRFTQEPLIGNWGVVYKAPNVPITSPVDLRNRRVALMEDSIHTDAFLKLMVGFRVKFSPIYVATYEDVLSAITHGVADAGVVNRLFANIHASRYRADLTGIMFNPIYVHYASHLDLDEGVILALDRYLRELKDTPDSLYYRSLKRWLADTAAPSIPTWLASVTIALAILLSASLLGAGALRKQLRTHILTLARRSDELRLETAQRRLAQEQSADAAVHDPLTDLPNRRACIEELPVLLRAADGHGTSLAVLLVDIDHFKDINESLGHAVGDALLREVTRRLHAHLHYRDKLFRFSGDEFVIVTRGMRGDADIPALAERLLQSLRAPMDVDGHGLFISASIGISRYPEDEREPHELLKDADIAMRHAKNQGRNRYCSYTRDMADQVYSRFRIGTQLRRALTEGGLSLDYQPIVKLDDATPIGMEALVRWHDPTDGTRFPDEFIPYAEESGLIEPLGAWALQAACAQTQQLRAQFHGLRIAVNVSVRQLESRRFTHMVANALEHSRLPPQALELEVTESVLLATSRDVGSVLNKLKDLGVRFAIDDFGIGYSSLSYLTRLPIDTLKIDKTFVAGLPHGTRHRQVVNTILAMGRGLELTVVAEGVENKAQLQALREQGCMYAQGFFISRPMALPQIETWLASRLTV